VLFLLDTSAISGLMRQETRIASWIASVRPDDALITCTIVRGEILFGLGRLAQGNRRTELEAKAAKLFAAMPCEAIPASAADQYANVKLTQQHLGLPLDENDLWIAATALAIGATLVSYDTDFQRVHTLSLVAL
jgi:predicted nucleic acid-binding protein